MDPAKVGLDFACIVFVTLRKGSRDKVQEFENAVGGIPEVVQEERLFGDPDSILHIFTRDLAEFQALNDDERLSA